MGRWLPLCRDDVGVFYSLEVEEKLNLEIFVSELLFFFDSLRYFQEFLFILLIFIFSFNKKSVSYLFSFDLWSRIV